MACRMAKLPKHYPGCLLGVDEAPIHLECFFDPLCEYSAKSFEVVKKLVSAYEGMLQARINLWIQPWHGQTTYVVKAIVACGLISRAAGWQLLESVFSNQDIFSDENVFRRSPQEIYDKLFQLIRRESIDRTEFFRKVHSEEVEQCLKFTAHYGRQNGIHFSPSFMLQGFHIFEADSSWSQKQWEKLLHPLCKDIDQYNKTRGGIHDREHREQQYHTRGQSEHEREREQRRGYSSYYYGSEQGQGQAQSQHREDKPGVFERVKEFFQGDEPRGRSGWQQEHGGWIQSAAGGAGGKDAARERERADWQRSDEDAAAVAARLREQNKQQEQIGKGQDKDKEKSLSGPIGLSKDAAQGQGQGQGTAEYQGFPNRRFMIM